MSLRKYPAPRLLAADDALAEFDPGEPSLDDWLKKRALSNNRDDASRTFVTVRDGRVAGYYAISAGAVRRDSAPSKVKRNQPDPVPVILLGRLAVDRKEQGRGLGAGLLRDAITRAVEASETVGVRALLVHALHEQARAFYLNFDFEQSPTDELHLFLLMKDARHSLP